ncbi:hypothetical protein [Flavobacterium sp. PL12]|uniref:hypothetical protein n=1 Tax=Flavobacterium sp. PL12 TaxID=3071718 RepID=UPI00319E992C
MGPIDFLKFNAVKKEYLEFYDLKKVAGELADLIAKFPLFKDYINFFNDEQKLEDIIIADNNELIKIKASFDLCKIKFEYENCTSPVSKKGKTENCMSCIACQNNKMKRDFHLEIMKILDYENKGKEYLRKVYSKIGMKTCYICNAQYALTIEPETHAIGISTQQKRYIAKFQFDHYLPKSEYPALSISLFNLLPICSSCNTIKGNREIGIDFLSTENNKWEGKFTFNILESTLTYFLLDQEPIEIDFIDKYIYPLGLAPISVRYDIKGIYNTQIDLIEELIIRKLKYSETYKDKLSISFPELFKNVNINERIELGTYTKKEDIHKRPMTKFLQDIDKQLEEYFQ